MDTPLGTWVSKSPSVFGVLVCLLVVYLISRKNPIPKGLRLPPGPPGKLIIGNATDMPTEQEWVTFAQWAKTYGDIVHLKALNMRIIAVNSIDVARELFDRRSSLYSDRFEAPMLNDLMGFDWNFGFMGYGERWRRRRRVFNQHLHQNAVVAYDNILSKQTRTLLKGLYESPNQFAKHIRQLPGASIMEIVYGIQVLPDEDPYIKIAEDAMDKMRRAGNPGTFLVDIFPMLKYVPPWMPGAGFQRKAREWKAVIAKMSVEPFEVAKKSVAAGTTRPSIAASLLESLSSKPGALLDKESLIRDSIGVAYAAGSDTTVSSISTFFLAMVLYPEAQRKAQEELDAVIGIGRLPEFDDRQNLPYVNALCKEVLRWRPVGPLGVAHRLMKDDVYGDFFIPGGSIIIGNAWTMLHDEKEFGPEPYKFIPERFLRPGATDPSVAWGFGRRICPGRYLADSTIFIAVASVLKSFNITYARDDDGHQIPVKEAYTSGFISHPEPFQCSITPRPGLAEVLFSN